MRNLGRRLTALEREADPPQWEPWSRVIVDVGENEEDAIAAYEAEHGPLDRDRFIVVQFVDTVVGNPAPGGMIQ